MVTLSLNSDYEKYRDNFIKEHGLYKFTSTSQYKQTTIKQPNLDKHFSLNYEYENARAELASQYKEYMPYGSYTLLKYKTSRITKYQHPNHLGEANIHVMDSDLDKLWKDNDMDNLKIFHSPDIELPFDARKDKYAIHIQRAWRRCISNPSYKVCRKRLLDEFDNLNSSSDNA
jgi:hypothetical protein